VRIVVGEFAIVKVSGLQIADHIIDVRSLVLTLVLWRQAAEAWPLSHLLVASGLLIDKVSDVVDIGLLLAFFLRKVLTTLWRVIAIGRRIVRECIASHVEVCLGQLLFLLCKHRFVMLFRIHKLLVNDRRVSLEVKGK